jgi:putative cardiolipin synthase
MLGHRMHNKLFAVDGQAAVMGGRNLSNHYFEGESETNFRDMDVFAAGPVVPEVLRQYDRYWNDAIVVPVAAFGADAGDGNALRAVEQVEAATLHAGAGVGAAAQYQRSRAEYERRVLQGTGDLVWAAVRPVTEPPVRQPPGAAKPSAEVARALAVERQHTRSDYTMETAYFVPGERGVEVLSGLAARGVRVRILTNSMASTDVPAVHSGYARYREALLAAGVQLHEYRVDAPRPIPSTQLLRSGRSDSALHAKVVVHDRRTVWIGTANFDPRSRRINTETGLLIDSEVLAARMLESMERDFAPTQSWRLALETDTASGVRRVVWTGEHDGKPQRLEHEPDAGLARRLRVLFYSLLPGIEELL